MKTMRVVLSELSDLCNTSYIYKRHRGRPKGATKDLVAFLQKTPLLLSIDVGKVVGIVVVSKGFVFLGQANDEDYLIAGTLAWLFDRYKDKMVVLVESGFCPCAEAIFRAGVAFGSFKNRGYPSIHLVHPNAKPAPAKGSDSVKKHFTFFCLREMGYDLHFPVPNLPHCASAFGLILKYLKDNKVRLPIDEAVRLTEAHLSGNFSARKGV